MEQYIEPVLRGSFGFETASDGALINSAMNVENLRRLWLHHNLVAGDDLGPGDRGDFDHGAWHVACHLAGAGGVLATRDGRLLWLEISHDPSKDDYYASVTHKVDGVPKTLRLDSAEGRLATREVKVMGFIEGTSHGRISARGAHDPTTLFKLWRRQDFDQPIESEGDGGKVWEHWCTLRDIRESARIGSAVLSAYVSLSSALGDLFIPTVARGRRDYGHPRQLVAMVEAGLVGRESALAKITPEPIPAAAETLLNEARPELALEVVESLKWPKPPHYFMFRRKIRSWSTAAQVRVDLKPEK